MTSLAVLVGVGVIGLIVVWVCVAIWIGKKGERAAKEDLKEWY